MEAASALFCLASQFGRTASQYVKARKDAKRKNVKKPSNPRPVDRSSEQPGSTIRYVSTGHGYRRRHRKRVGGQWYQVRCCELFRGGSVASSSGPGTARPCLSTTQRIPRTTSKYSVGTVHRVPRTMSVVRRQHIAIYTRHSNIHSLSIGHRVASA
eukprot:357954-Rhodomonas_salina.2